MAEAKERTTNRHLYYSAEIGHLCLLGSFAVHKNFLISCIKNEKGGNE
ncbi:hypothetical protein GTCCBUS3UF5_5070 [Geobacillus thermoleovorans CCB_US3_UF5]|uniref:Uncharacterized protein n=1 Tax=Geobacillus thermoleovorans CCB_US3_UF5 TaxID=1111068 RepID=A0ABM5ME55_GEOTH|nr:hypothetical protein GTCCBUS3UF5_5070 [Geobacillus thermoleovorans CCB_US3_UF5]